LRVHELIDSIPERTSMRTESVMNYARVAAASIILAALGTAATAQELPSFMAPIAGRTDSTPA
jgi:hypothetical protein